MSYDRWNRVSGRTYVKGSAETTSAVTYTYDKHSPANLLSYAKGRLTEVLVTGGTEQRYLQYDALGRVTKSSQKTAGQTYPFEYTYNAAGGLESETYPGNRTVTTCYDVAGRVKSVKNGTATSGDVYAEVADGADPESGTTTKGYSALGGIQRLRLQNGTMTQRWNYNDRGQTELLAMYQTPASGSATTLMKLTLGYGTAAANNGNVRSQGITLGSFSASQAYEYDEWNRLKTAAEGTNWKQEFGYDRWGNRWIVPSGTSGVAIATTTATGPSWFSSGTNRLALAADATDAAGNQSPNGAWRNRFDVENRLTKVEDPSTTPAVVAGTYEYDGDGRRVKRTVGSVTTVYVYNAMGELVQEYGGTAAAAGRSYLFQDHLGTTRLRAGSDGVRQGWWDYTPFGEVVPGSAGNRSGVANGAYEGARPGPMFTGQEKDAESGLDYFGARYMATAQGRFTGPDAPFADQQEGDPKSWNMYAYVRSSPLIYIDPSGTDCVYVNGSGTEVSSINNEINSAQCGKTGGYWVDGTVVQARFAFGSLILTGTTNGDNRTSVSYGLRPDPGLLALQRGTQLAEPGVNLAAGGTAIVVGGAVGGMAYGAYMGGQGVTALGLELLPSQARNIQTIETIIADHVTMSDLAGGAKEVAGFAIRTGSKVWNHKQELQEAARGIGRAIKNLQGSLNDPSHGAATRQVVQAAIQKGQTYLRMINAALGR